MVLYRLSKTCYFDFFVVLPHPFSYYITFFVLHHSVIPRHSEILICPTEHYKQISNYRYCNLSGCWEISRKKYVVSVLYGSVPLYIYLSTIVTILLQTPENCKISAWSRSHKLKPFRMKVSQVLWLSNVKIFSEFQKYLNRKVPEIQSENPNFCKSLRTHGQRLSWDAVKV